MPMRFISLSILFAATLPAVAQDLRVGAAAVKITPQVGTPMAGYYYERPSKGVHDDLFARALVLEKDGVRAALVAVDLISTSAIWVEQARREIAGTTNLRGDQVMISATHAHTGPILSTRTLLATTLGGQSDLARRYTEELPGKIARAVQEAEKHLTPAVAWAGRSHESAIAFNRRYHMSDGTVGWNPGLLNPRIVKPAGTIDPEVPFVYFESLQKKPLAIYVNYAVHLDNVGGALISADMPAVVARLLGEYKGPDLVTVYTTGCCGDVNHLNVRWGQRQSGFEQAARMGTILAAAILRAWPEMKPIEPGALRSSREIVKLPAAPITARDVERARGVLARLRDPQAAKPKFLEQVDAFKVLDVDARQGKPWEVEVQTVTLGQDLSWISLPGEIFVELGLAIKQDSPFKLNMIAELANGSIGYIPSRRAYPQGNYEVVSARCAEGSGEMLVASAVRQLKKAYLAPGKSSLTK
jgi:neutral ceramidase